MGPAGGGYGDPLERDPEAVLDDVVDGLISRESALRCDYRVAITDDLALDRATRPASSAPPPEGRRHPAYGGDHDLPEEAALLQQAAGLDALRTAAITLSMTGFMRPSLDHGDQRLDVLGGPAVGALDVELARPDVADVGRRIEAGWSRRR